MIEPKLTFFEMQIKSGFGKSPELCQTHFGNAPEVFNTVDVRLFIGEFIFAMLHPVVFFITQIHEAIIAFPPIGVDRALKVHLAPDHRL